MAKMTEDELLGIVDNEERAALGYLTGELAQQREKALKYYLAEPFGNEVEGRSQVVDTTVADTVEWILPSLLKIFTASGQAVEFEPTGPEDVQQARQAGDACNYVFFKQNNGFLILYTWFKDALIEKNGVVKYYAENYTKSKKESYRGLTDEQLTMLVKDDGVEVLTHQAYDDPIAKIQIAQASQMAQSMGQQMAQPPVPQLHDVMIETKKDSTRICVEPVPPEEFLITPRHNSVSLEGCTFCEHRSKKTISDLLLMGYKEKDLEDVGYDDDMTEISGEYLARRRYTEEQFPMDQSDDVRRSVWCREAYIEVDFDGDGITELRKVFSVGKKILENEEVDQIPFAAISPIIMPHRYAGQSVAEIIMDLQLIKSTLWRQMLDNLYLANAPRKAVLSTQGGMVYANLDDLLSSRPGGIVREYQPNAVRDLETPFVAAASFPMLQYIDETKANRTGITKYNQGTDADSLNHTAHGISQIMGASQQRIELIARVFAETGVKDLFKGILKLLSQSGLREMVIHLDNQFIPVDPREWNTEWNMTVTVGLGTGNKDQQLMHLQMIGQAQEKLMGAGLTNIVTPQNLYKTAAKIVENAGYKHVEEFFTDPTGTQPPQPRPDPETIKGQVEIQKKQMDGQSSLQVEQIRAQLETSLKQIDAQSRIEVARISASAQIEVEAMKAQYVDALRSKEIAAEAELEIFRANANAHVEQARITAERDKAAMGNHTQLQTAALSAQTQKETAQQKAKDTQDKSRNPRGEDVKKSDNVIAGVTKALEGVQKTHEQLVNSLQSKPTKRVTRVLRDEKGNLTGAETIEQ